MRARMWALALLASVLGVISLAAPAFASSSAPVANAAHAARATPPPPTGDSAIWLTNFAPGLVANTNGLGNQLTMGAFGTAYYVNTTTDAGYYKIKVTGTTDHCLEADNTPVNTKTCSPGADNQEFRFTHDSGIAGCLINSKSQTSNDWGVYNPATNKPVWDDSPAGGGYRRWSFQFSNGPSC